MNKLADFSRRYQSTDKRRIDQEIAIDAVSGDSKPGLSLSAEQSTPSSQMMHDEQSQALARALQRLPEHYRQVLVWRQWDDLSFEEIAQRLNRSVDSVRKLWLRGLERLQEEMGASP